MPWSDYAPLTTDRTATDMLNEIVMRSTGWIGVVDPFVLPPPPSPLPPTSPPLPLPPGTPPRPPLVTLRDYWSYLRTAAQMDLANSGHGRLRIFVTPAGGLPTNQLSFQKPWADVRDCLAIVSLPAPSHADLQMAVDFIDHMGSGLPGVVQTGTSQAQTSAALWPDVAFGTPKIQARAYHDALLALALGRLTVTPIFPTLRTAYEKLVIAVVLDRANVAHGKLRQFVKPDGRAVSSGSFNAAWTHLRGAWNDLNAFTVSATAVNKACKRVHHFAVP